MTADESTVAAAERVAALLNILRAEGFIITMGDWPECHISITHEDYDRYAEITGDGKGRWRVESEVIRRIVEE